MLKDGARLTFVEKRNNLYYLRAKITVKVIIDNYKMQEPNKKELSVMSGNKDSDSNGDEEEDDTPTICAHIARKKSISLKDVVTNNPIVTQK